MQLSKACGGILALGLVMAALTTSRQSHAGDEALLNVACTNGAVTVTTSSPWHINDKAPWKWDKGQKTAVDEHAATFKGDKCEGTIKAYVCSGGQCKGPIAVNVK